MALLLSKKRKLILLRLVFSELMKVLDANLLGTDTQYIQAYIAKLGDF